MGTNNGTVSDIDGRFSISVNSSESVLIFSFIGYQSQEITVGSASNLEISMVDDTQNLSEIIVVGYGYQEKKDVTGAMSTIKAEDFNKGIVNTPEDLIQGKIAG